MGNKKESKNNNRYIGAFMQCMENPPEEIGLNGKQIKNAKRKSEADLVVSALGVVNAMSMTGGFLTGNVSNEEKEDIKSFINWFLGKYGRRDDVFAAIDENWPQEPRIFRLYEWVMQDEYEHDLEISWNSLLKSEQEKVRTLANIIWSHRAYRELTVSHANGESSSFVIQRTVPKEELEHTKEMLKLVIADFVRTGGGMIYRRETKNKKFKVYGFSSRIINGRRSLESIPANELKIACETMPDGSRQVWDGETYDTIRLPWEADARKSGFYVVK